MILIAKEERGEGGGVDHRVVAARVPEAGINTTGSPGDTEGIHQAVREAVHAVDHVLAGLTPGAETKTGTDAVAATLARGHGRVRDTAGSTRSRSTSAGEGAQAQGRNAATDTQSLVRLEAAQTEIAVAEAQRETRTEERGKGRKRRRRKRKRRIKH